MRSNVLYVQPSAALWTEVTTSDFAIGGLCAIATGFSSPWRTS